MPGMKGPLTGFLGLLQLAENYPASPEVNRSDREGLIDDARGSASDMSHPRHRAIRPMDPPPEKERCLLPRLRYRPRIRARSEGRSTRCTHDDLTQAAEEGSISAGEGGRAADIGSGGPPDVEVVIEKIPDPNDLTVLLGRLAAATPNTTCSVTSVRKRK